VHFGIKLYNDQRKAQVFNLFIYIRYSDWLRAGRSRDRIPVGARFFADRSWGPPSLLYYGYRVFPGVKATGAWCWPPPPTNRRRRELLAIYLYSSSGPLVACYRANFTLFTSALYISGILIAHLQRQRTSSAVVQDCWVWCQRPGAYTIPSRLGTTAEVVYLHLKMC
jgi:hypothetical protein